MSEQDPQLRDLIARAQSGDQDAVAEIVRQHWGLMMSLVSRMKHRKLYMHTPEDIEQEAVVALLEAIPDFDPDGPASFGHYVWLHVRWHLLYRLYFDHPTRLGEVGEVRMRKAKRELEAAGEPVTIDALVERIGFSRETVKRMYNATLPPRSLDQGAAPVLDGDLDGADGYYDCVNDEGGWGFKGNVRRPTEDEALERVYREQAREAIEQALSPENMLTDGEREAVRARYEGHGKKETAALLGMTLYQAGNFYCRGAEKARALLANFAPLPGRAYRGVRPERVQDGRLRWSAWVPTTRRARQRWHTTRLPASGSGRRRC